jgi:hypothetical protein
MSIYVYVNKEKIMNCYIYQFQVNTRGIGQGIIFDKDKKSAKEKVKASYNFKNYAKNDPELCLRKINVNKKQIIDMSDIE